MTLKGLNKHQLFLLCKKNTISYKQVCYIVNGQSIPKPKTMRVLANALNEPFSDLLMASGYIQESDVEDINDMLRDVLKPIFADGIADLITHELMMKILDEILTLSKEDQEECLLYIFTLVSGFVNQRKDEQ